MALAFNVYTVPLFVAAAISLVLLLLTFPFRQISRVRCHYFQSFRGLFFEWLAKILR